MQSETEIVFPPFRLDLRAEKLWREEQEIAIRPKTFAILRYLAQHPERLVSKAELLRAIWGEVQVSEEGLRDYIREIRKALSDSSTSPHFVETALGRGYRFVGRVASSQQSVVHRTEDSRNDRQEKNGVTRQQPTSPALLTIRGVYDGKEFRALPTEALPDVSRETVVLIVFLENESAVKGNGRQET
jgi:DNA-binding winged helix-turn-helix (wHTH) protein